MGTGGAIRNVVSALESGPDDPVIVFNGDVLTGPDLAGFGAGGEMPMLMLRFYLTRVEDPRAFGLVPTDSDETTAFA